MRRRLGDYTYVLGTADDTSWQSLLLAPWECRLPDWAQPSYVKAMCQTTAVKTITAPAAPLTQNQMTTPRAWTPEEINAYTTQKESQNRLADVLTGAAGAPTAAPPPDQVRQDLSPWIWAAGGVAAVLILKGFLR